MSSRNRGSNRSTIGTARRDLRRALLAGLAVALLLAGTIAWRNYRSESDTFAGAPSAALVATPEAAGVPGLRNVRFPRRGDGVMVAAWQVPTRNGAAVILAHGVVADRTTLLDETRLLAAAGFGVLAIDWPGHGLSAGPADWGPVARAALLGALDWLARQPGQDPARIGAYGFSMGGYLVAQVAADEPRIAALVLAAPVTDIRWQSQHEHGKWGWLSRWPAQLALSHGGLPIRAEAPIAALPRFAPRPLLLIAGTDDRLVPASRLREVFEQAGEPKTFWPIAGAGHGGWLAASPEAYRRRLPAFYRCGLLGDCPP